jgi:hypothetical protein
VGVLDLACEGARVIGFQAKDRLRCAYTGQSARVVEVYPAALLIRWDTGEEAILREMDVRRLGIEREVNP